MSARERTVRQAAGFLRGLHQPEDGDEGHVVLFSLPTRRVRAFSVGDLDAAAREAVRLADTENVYVGVGLQGEPPEAGSRGSADGVVAIPGLWMDLDLRAPYRSRSDLPAGVAEAQTFLEELPLRPTCIVHSGGGLYPWWVFREPWAFDSDAERQQAAALSKGWQRYVIELARHEGWSLDSTPDLARILRLPGTLNHKTDPPAPVRILEAAGPRYVPSDFEDFVVPDPDRPSRPLPSEPPVDAGTPRRRAYVTAAIEAECLAVANAPEGDRNNCLNKAAFSLARFIATREADPAKLADALTYAAEHAGLAEHEITKTIASAFRAREVAV